MPAYPINVREPSKCSDAERLAFIDVAARSEEVKVHHIRDGVPRARALLWMANEREVVAVAAIKNPQDTYRKSAFTKAGMADKASGFPLEFGYLFVDPEQRGKRCGPDLTDVALKLLNQEAVFATTRLNNDKMQRILENRLFTRIGNPYPSSDDPNRLLCLYVRPAQG